MDIVLLTKRGISFQRVRRGEQTVLLIPSNENIKIYKDVNDSATLAERYGAANQKPLWRQREGQTVMYGVLPESLAQRRQAMRVHLPQDFVPAGNNAFYYVMDSKWIVHGRKEIDDEGREDWRVTLLKVPEKTAVAAYLQNAIAEMVMDRVESRVTLAIYENVDLYDAVKEALAPYDIQPVSFTTLKLNPRAKALYRQRDFSPLMWLSLLIALAVLAAASFYWFVQWTQSSKLAIETEQVQKQIVGIEINKSLGNITAPESVLEAMEKAFTQMPSAIMDASIDFGSEFGELDHVEFDTAKTDVLLKSKDIRSIEHGQQVVQISIRNRTNMLLVDQERLARLLMAERPWIRRVENMPQGQSALTLVAVVQAEEKASK